MAKVKLIVAKTPEQLARILGLTPQHAATWTVQGALQKRITQIVKKDKFTHAALAKWADDMGVDINEINQKL